MFWIPSKDEGRLEVKDEPDRKETEGFQVHGITDARTAAFIQRAGFTTRISRDKRNTFPEFSDSGASQTRS